MVVESRSSFGNQAPKYLNRLANERFRFGFSSLLAQYVAEIIKREA